MNSSERTFPELLTKLHELDFDYADGAGYDFEPYTEFLPESETRDWMRIWSQDRADGSQFLVFGQDGTGGYAAIWRVRPASELLEQPVVFFGSEGAVGMVARNFAEYLWLLAGGIGPMEAVEYPGSPPAPEHVSAPFRRFAEAHAPASRAAPAEIVRMAAREFPDFAREYGGD